MSLGNFRQKGGAKKSQTNEKQGNGGTCEQRFQCDNKMRSRSDVREAQYQTIDSFSFRCQSMQRYSKRVSQNLDTDHHPESFCRSFHSLL